MTGPRIGSLFSGYGGLEQGVQAVLGGSTAWVSDIDKGACKILAHRYPDVPNLGDISAVDWSAVEPVDVLTGGFPCQDVSHAGKRAGLRPDTRTGLWSQMAYAIDQLRPALVVAENVRGLLSAEAHSDLEPCPWCMGDGSAGSPLRALGAVLGDLADIGYDASWYGLRAADVGAPHGRFRVFVVAYPAGDEWDAWTDRMKAEHGNGNGHGKSLSIEAARLVYDESRCVECGCPEHLHDEGGFCAGRCGGEMCGETRQFIARLLPTPSAMAPDAKVSDRARELYSSTDRLGDVVEQSAWGEYAPAIARWEALTRPAPAPTQWTEQYVRERARRLAGKDKRPVGRRGSLKPRPQLAPAFVEWMMGLPAGWVTDVPGITRNEALKALGNGVVPQQAEAALRFLLSVQAVAA